MGMFAASLRGVRSCGRPGEILDSLQRIFQESSKIRWPTDSPKTLQRLPETFLQTYRQSFPHPLHLPIHPDHLQILPRSSPDNAHMIPSGSVWEASSSPEAPKRCPVQTSILKDVGKIIGIFGFDFSVLSASERTAASSPEAPKSCPESFQTSNICFYFACDLSCNARPPCSRSAGSMGETCG